MATGVSRVGMSRHSCPPRPAPAGGAGKWIALGVGAVLLVVAVVAFFLLRGGSPAAAPTPAPASGVQTMARELADTRAKLARRKLDAGDYAPERPATPRKALEMDPANAEARGILDEMKARSATRSGRGRVAPRRLVRPGPRRRGPRRPAPRPVDARRSPPPAPPAAFGAGPGRAPALMAEARKAAEQAGGGDDEAAGLAAQGEQALRATTPWPPRSAPRGAGPPAAGRTLPLTSTGARPRCCADSESVPTGS
ncbi:MAG: hypothetical protein U0599_06755 [Vicinamibacteria bacterium]